MSKVVIIHPDLGLGGAERLIVDLSLALEDLDYDVHIYTSYHDKRRCFEETRNGLLRVTTIGSWIPRSIFGKCHALMAYIKMMIIAIFLLFFSQHDIVICDQVSACIPILKLDWMNKPKIIFYCHFPDQLLTNRDSFLKRQYRRPLDYFEGWSTSLADLILVNSEFTYHVVKNTFSNFLGDRTLKCLYPCVNVRQLKCSASYIDYCGEIFEESWEEMYRKTEIIFLSLNRFERKKDLELAIKAFSVIRCEESLSCSLLIAGGYDERVEENVSYLRELERLVVEYDANNPGEGIADHVLFFKSPTEIQKRYLLNFCDVVLYTPSNEHFGIVPLEAMAVGKPVIACASGGPLETIIDKETGFLCSNNVLDYADKMRQVIKLYKTKKLKYMGNCARIHVENNFSFRKFREDIDEILNPELYTLDL